MNQIHAGFRIGNHVFMRSYALIMCLLISFLRFICRSLWSLVDRAWTCWLYRQYGVEPDELSAHLRAKKHK